MEPEEFVCEQILLLLKILPYPFPYDNTILSVLTGTEKHLLSKVLGEMIETGLIYRWMDIKTKSRFLSLHPRDSEDALLQQKNSPTNFEVVLLSYYSIILSKSNSFLLRKKQLSLSKLYNNTPVKTDRVHAQEDFNTDSKGDLGKEQQNNIPTLNTPANEGKFVVPGVVKEIVQFWNNTPGLKKVQIRDTKKFNSVWSKINKARKGTLLLKHPDLEQRKFSMFDILQAMKNFKLAAFDSDYDPPNWMKERLRNTELPDFLYSEFSNSEENRCMILKYQNPPKTAVKMEEDKYPQVSSVLRKFYKKEILGRANVDKITPSDENKIRKASIKLSKFFLKNKNKFLHASVMGGVTTVKISGWMCESIKWDREMFGNNTIPLTAGFLCSDRTFEYRLPAYLKEQGIWE